jgi:hypothetical protein
MALKTPLARLGVEADEVVVEVEEAKVAVRASLRFAGRIYSGARRRAMFRRATLAAAKIVARSSN